MKYFIPLILLFFSSLSFSQDEHNHTVAGSTETKLSMNFGIYEPTRPEDCAREIHNKYSGVRPADGYRYHMYHPTRDPETGCTFGHDHGMPPELSPLEELFGPIYFGVANQVAMLGGVQMVHTCKDQVTGAIVRCEDNVGQKTLHGRREFTPNDKSGLIQACDARVQFHMGTHSIDAATNNLHGFTYQLGNCDGQQDMYFDVTFLAQIEKPGGFSRLCDAKRIEMGTPTPFNSPTVVNPLNTGRSFGTRNISETFCVAGKTSHTVSRNFHELWRAVVVVNSPVPTIKTSIFWNPRTRIINPNSAGLQVNWYWNASPTIRVLNGATKGMDYAVDMCDERTATGAFMAISGPCVTHQRLEAKLGRDIPYNDPDAFANGGTLGMRLTGFQLKNGPSATKPTVWFTDTAGLNPSLDYFPGALRWEGQPTEWWVNAIGTDARMVEYPGSIKVRVAALNTPIMGNTPDALNHSIPAGNPDRVHAPN